MMNIVLYFQEVRQELMRVVWPSWDDLVGSTVIVLIIIAAFTVFLGAVDFVFSQMGSYIYTS